ncbi:MAG TPA: hypothetical protein VLA30_01370 [Burkholderiales bacterium]|nr:hypothetical protein [Burkholderiales bacterium]
MAIIGSSTPRAARHLERDVQVEVVLVLELEGHVGRLEEGEVRAVVEPVERVQHAGLAAGFVQRNAQGSSYL